MERRREKTELGRALEAMSTALTSVRLGPTAQAAFPDGHSALALAHHTLDRALPGRGHAARADRHLGRAIDSLGATLAATSLFGGFTGVAWVAEHIAGSDGEGDMNAAIDEALGVVLAPKRWRTTFDLVRGLVGYGVYALERMPRPSATALLEKVVEHLAAMAQETPAGITWRSSPSWLPKQMRTPLSRGWDLGVAHGVPGIVALLGRVWRAGVAKRETARLLDGAVTWVLAQELPKGESSRFPTCVLPNGERKTTRAAWCYGDPGVAAALLVAARASGEASWKRAALRIGASAAARSEAESGVQDAGLCHGAAGLAHIFQRIYVETEDARFERAAREWLARMLAMRHERRGIAGFPTYSPVPGKPGEVAYRRDPSFLTGSAGIAMVLASMAMDPGEEGWGGWDRVLLLSDGPPAR